MPPDPLTANGPAPGNGDTRATSLCVLGVILALLAVGFVSGTVVQHLIQVVPLVLAVIVAQRWKPAVGAWAAVSLLSFWMVVMVLIWLFLLGVSEVVEGRYTVVEVALTVVIGGFCAVGILNGARGGRSLNWWQSALTIAIGWAVQVAVMALSFAVPVANR